jgi:serine protease Do
MNSWKTLALAAALAGAAGLGAAFAPAVLAQSRAAVALAPAQVYSFAGGSRIGVSIRDVETSDKTRSGVVIESVDDDSPAAKAGLKAGDVVIEFDGERVRSVRQFTRLVSETPEGRTVAAVAMRDGQRVTVNVAPESGRGVRWLTGEPMELLRRFETVPPRPARPAPPTPPAPRPAPLPPTLERFFWTGTSQLGITGSDLEPQLAEYFGAKDGVLVASVSAESAAAKAGLKAGDVIVSFNGESIEGLSELRSRIRQVDGQEFTIGILRDKKSMTLKGRLETPTERRRTTPTRVIL